MKTDLERIRQLQAEKERFQGEIDRIQDELFSIAPGGVFCNMCGETNPKHGFYPLMVMGAGRCSPVDCNKCRRSIKEYKELFGEEEE